MSRHFLEKYMLWKYQDHESTYNNERHDFLTRTNRGTLIEKKMKMKGNRCLCLWERKRMCRLYQPNTNSLQVAVEGDADVGKSRHSALGRKTSLRNLKNAVQMNQSSQYHENMKDLMTLKLKNKQKTNAFSFTRSILECKFKHVILALFRYFHKTWSLSTLWHWETLKGVQVRIWTRKDIK